MEGITYVLLLMNLEVLKIKSVPLLCARSIRHPPVAAHQGTQPPNHAGHVYNGMTLEQLAMTIPEAEHLEIITHPFLGGGGP